MECSSLRLSLLRLRAASRPCLARNAAKNFALSYRAQKTSEYVRSFPTIPTYQYRERLLYEEIQGKASTLSL